MRTDKYESARKEVKERIRECRGRAEAVARVADSEGRDLDDVEQLAVDAALEEARSAKKMLRSLPRQPKVKVKREPATYREGGEHSFYADLIAATSPVPVPGIHSHHARDRLLRNSREVRAHERANVRLAESRAASLGVQVRGSEDGPAGRYTYTRDLSETTGSGLEFAPPAYLVSEFANVARSDAPLWRYADTSIPLPKGCYEVLIPTITSDEGGQAAPVLQNTPLAADGFASSSVGSYVTAVVSEVVVSYQALEQGGVDRWVSRFAAEDLAAQVESLLWTGTGTAQPTGLLNAGIGVVMTPGQTLLNYQQALGGALATVAKNRLRPATHVFAHPLRAEAVFGYPQTGGTDAVTIPGLPALEEPVVATFANRPVVATAGIPTTELSDGDGSYCPFVAGRPSELLVMSTEPVHRILLDQYAPQLSALVQTHLYVAAIPRFASAWAYTAGMNAPS